VFLERVPAFSRRRSYLRQSDVIFISLRGRDVSPKALQRAFAVPLSVTRAAKKI